MEYFPDTMMGNISEWAKDWPVIMEGDDPSQEGGMVFHPQRLSVVIYGTFLCVWMLAVNVVLAAGAWAAKRMEVKINIASKFKNVKIVPGKMLILVFAVVQILQATLVVPMHVKVEAIGYWTLGLTFCRVWLVAEVFLLTVTTWCLVMINMDSLVYAMKPLLYYTALRGLKEFTMVLACATVAFGLCVPITSWMHDEDFILPEVCATQVNPKYSVTLSLVAYFVPLVLIATAVLVFACVLYTARNIEREPLGYATYSDIKRIFMTLCVVNFVYFSLWLPFHLSNLIIPYCKEMCVNPHIWSLFIWFGMTAAALVAPVWYVNPYLRQFLSKLCCKEKADTHAWISLKGSSDSKVNQV